MDWFVLRFVWFTKVRCRGILHQTIYYMTYCELCIVSCDSSPETELRPPGVITTASHVVCSLAQWPWRWCHIWASVPHMSLTNTAWVDGARLTWHTWRQLVFNHSNGSKVSQEEVKKKPQTKIKCAFAFEKLQGSFAEITTYTRHKWNTYL